MIRIDAYNAVDGRFLVERTVEQLPQDLENPDLYLWVDFDNPTPDEAMLLKSVFNLDALAIEDCMHPRQAPKLETFNAYHFFIVQGSLPPCDDDGCGSITLKGFLADRYLITYHDEPIPGIENSRRGILSGNCRLREGAAYLAYEILDQMIDMYMPVLDFFDRTIEELEQTLSKSLISDAAAQDYLQLSRQLLDVRRGSVRNQEVFYQLSHSGLKFIEPQEARLFKDIYDHVIRMVDMSEYYQQTLRSILEIHLSLSSNRTNQVAQMLTVVATIMVPLYIITGIYGMNFTYIPLASNPYGFYIIIGLMVVIAGSMIAGFRMRRWI